MKRINYISNLDVHEVGGGWSGFNNNVYGLLKSFTKINLVDGVNPPLSLQQRIMSRIQRILGIPALFPAFSRNRLKCIASLVENKIDKQAELNFFHGSTPWVMVKNNHPFICYLDASFRTYLDIYHKGYKFKSKKITELETKFLREAKAVFFSSRYSLEQTKNAYSLEGKNFYHAGLGGNLSYHDKLLYSERKKFVFIGHDYFGKGGDLVAEAFRKWSKQNPGFQLTFIGGEPSGDVLDIPGVEYVGYLDKRDEAQLKKYKEILVSAVALVLPTTRDLTPLVIIEAGYCGCPSIATNAYGIPEMIGDHGYLCNLPIQVEDIVKAMTILRDRKGNPAAIRDFYINNFSWESVSRIIKSVVLEE